MGDLKVCAGYTYELEGDCYWQKMHKSVASGTFVSIIDNLLGEVEGFFFSRMIFFYTEEEEYFILRIWLETKYMIYMVMAHPL